jgi:predicted Zn-dependent protease
MKTLIKLFVLVAGFAYLLDEVKQSNSKSYSSVENYGIYLPDESVEEVLEEVKSTHSDKKNDEPVRENNEFVEEVSHTKNEFSHNTIYLHGFGDYNESDLETIRKGVENFWGLKCSVSKPLYSPSDFYFLEDGKTLIGDNVLTIGGENGYHMYVTNYPLTGKSKYRTISGYAGTNKKTAVVTTHQVIERGTYSARRMINISNHELGHNFGLNHCDNQNCLMKSEGLDANDLCDNCKLKLNQ